MAVVNIVHESWFMTHEMVSFAPDGGAPVALIWSKDDPPSSIHTSKGGRNQSVNHTPSTLMNMNHQEPSLSESDESTSEAGCDVLRERARPTQLADAIPGLHWETTSSVDSTCSAMSTTASTPTISSSSTSPISANRPRQHAAKSVTWGQNGYVRSIPAPPRASNDTRFSAELLTTALNKEIASQGATVENERSTRRGARKTVTWAAYAHIRSIPARSSTDSHHQEEARAARVEDVCVLASEGEIAAEQEAELFASVLRQTRHIPWWASRQ